MQEEADTKILLHIYSPDTDVFILALRRYMYPDLCDKVSFVTGTGQHHKVIKLRPIVQALGEAKTAALPAFHAISGSDNRSFSGKGKLACWKIFRDTDEAMITELGNLGTTVTPTTDTTDAIERFVCQLYLPKTTFTKVKDLRWWLFGKKQAQSERLPPTLAALHEAIVHAHHQIMVWNNDREPNPDLPPPDTYGGNVKKMNGNLS